MQEFGRTEEQLFGTMTEESLCSLQEIKTPICTKSFSENNFRVFNFTRLIRQSALRRLTRFDTETSLVGFTNPDWNPDWNLDIGQGQDSSGITASITVANTTKQGRPESGSNGLERRSSPDEIPGEKDSPEDYYNEWIQSNVG